VFHFPIDNVSPNGIQNHHHSRWGCLKFRPRCFRLLSKKGPLSCHICCQCCDKGYGVWDLTQRAVSIRCLLQQARGTDDLYVFQSSLTHWQDFTIRSLDNQKDKNTQVSDCLTNLLDVIVGILTQHRSTQQTQWFPVPILLCSVSITYRVHRSGLFTWYSLCKKVQCFILKKNNEPF
jgi:hypothetical protein